MNGKARTRRGDCARLCIERGLVAGVEVGEAAEEGVRGVPPLRGGGPPPGPPLLLLRLVVVLVAAGAPRATVRKSMGGKGWKGSDDPCGDRGPWWLG